MVRLAVGRIPAPPHHQGSAKKLSLTQNYIAVMLKSIMCERINPSKSTREGCHNPTVLQGQQTANRRWPAWFLGQRGVSGSSLCSLRTEGTAENSPRKPVRRGQSPTQAPELSRTTPGLIQVLLRPSGSAVNHLPTGKRVFLLVYQTRMRTNNLRLLPPPAGQR